jgi:hypothetical protein
MANVSVTEVEIDRLQARHDELVALIADTIKYLPIHWDDKARLQSLVDMYGNNLIKLVESGG